MKRAALFVGVNRYEDPEINPLQFAESDATELYAFFKHRAGYDDVRHLLNPDDDSILDTASKMIRGLQSDDLFLFFFAGHGVEHEGRHLLLCPEFRYASLRFFRHVVPLDLFKQVTAKEGLHRVLILDACRSDLLAGRRGGGTGLRDVQCLRNMVHASPGGPGSLALVCSCDEGQQARELPQIGQGLFTRALLELFQSAEQAAATLTLGDEFEERLVTGMRNLARGVGIDAAQRPWFQKSGPVPAILTWTGAAAPRPLPQPPSEGTLTPGGVQESAAVTRERHNGPMAATGKRDIEGDVSACAEHFGVDEAQLKRRLREKVASRLTTWKTAADNEDPGAQWLLALCYEYGYGVARDPVKAARLHRKAAKHGHSWGQLSLGRCYEGGFGLAQNAALAAEWVLQAAGQGNAFAQKVLGSYYNSGFGVAKDFEAAAEWYQRAAEQGNAEAQNGMGVFYCNGQGVEQNYASAVSWYRKAAEQGLAWGQYNLANSLYAGNGCKVDLSQAVAWYRKAAGQGNADAQKRLGEIRNRHLLDPQPDVDRPVKRRSQRQSMETLKCIDDEHQARINLTRLNPGSEGAFRRQAQLAESLELPVEAENSIGMRFRLIPSGAFSMGSAEGAESERPVHGVTLSRPFWIGRYPVTQAQWTKVLGPPPGQSPRVLLKTWPVKVLLVYGGILSLVMDNQDDDGLRDMIFGVILFPFILIMILVMLYQWFRRSPDRMPVENVSWDDVQMFLKKMSELEGVPNGTYRLPTEAEWEYACRAGTAAEHYGAVDKVVVRKENAPSSSDRVGTRLPNAWGLSDMLGNINEWCLDIWSGYPAAATTDPCVNDGTDSRRCARGGSFVSGANSCRSASRYAEKPDARMMNLGFRIVRTMACEPS